MFNSSRGRQTHTDSFLKEKRQRMITLCVCWGGVRHTDTQEGMSVCVCEGVKSGIWIGREDGCSMCVRQGGNL